MTKHEFMALKTALISELEKGKPELLLESDGSHNYHQSVGAVLQWGDDMDTVKQVLNEVESKLLPR